MGQNSKNMDKVLKEFYENPEKSFTIRELTSKTNIPKSSVHKYLVQLKKENLVTSENKASNSYLFKTKKTFYFIEKMINIGLIEQIIKDLNPSCIILFGSFRKGESEKDSDIDLFIESIKKTIDLTKFEKKLNHRIQLFIEDDINNLPERLFNNVINGIKLKGYFKVKK